MATLEEFMGRYQAYYGKFPLDTNQEKDRDALAVWRRWIAPITPDKMENIFKGLNDYRAKEGIRMRPLLEAFQRTEAASDIEMRGGDSRSAEIVEAEAKMETPLFDFDKEGFPRRREAYLVELPRKTIKRFSETWEELATQKITSKEFKKRVAEERWYLPDWNDYEPEEQERLCRNWKVRNPDEVPF